LPICSNASIKTKGSGNYDSPCSLPTPHGDLFEPIVRYTGIQRQRRFRLMSCSDFVVKTVCYQVINKQAVKTGYKKEFSRLQFLSTAKIMKISL